MRPGRESQADVSPPGPGSLHNAVSPRPAAVPGVHRRRSQGIDVRRPIPPVPFPFPALPATASGRTPSPLRRSTRCMLTVLRPSLCSPVGLITLRTCKLLAICCTVVMLGTAGVGADIQYWLDDVPDYL